MRKRLERMPDGKLVRKKARVKIYFYADKKGRLYSLLKQKKEKEYLLEKEHIEQTLRKIEHDLPLLERIAEQYEPITEWENIWEKLGNNENTFRRENQRHFYRGVYYRSKSEMSIAMLLTSYGIEFKYECTIMQGGQKIHPDFAVKRPKNGQVIYWEHFGRTDLDDYRGTMYERIESYRSNGIDVWDRLVISFETEDGAINADKIDKLIKAFIIE